MSPRRLRAGLGLSAAILLAGLVLGSLLLLERMRGAARSAAIAGLEQTARAAEAAVNRHFLQVDGTLARLPAMLRTAAGSGPLDQARANRVLQDINVQNLSFRDVLLVQPGGRIWAASLLSSRQIGLPVEPAMLDAAAARGALAVLGPVRNPATSEWSLFLVRGISLPGVGRMVAAIEVPVQLVTGLLAPMGDAARVRIFLQRAEGDLLASVPHDEGAVGRRLPRPEGFRADGAAFEAPQPDGARWLEVARPMLYNGIHVRVGRDVKDALADFERDRNWLAVMVAGVGVMLLCLTLAMHLGLRQRERVDAERTAARALLENAIEAMPDGFVMWDAEDRLVTCNARFRELYRESADLLVPGTTFIEVMREGVRRGQYPQCGDDPEAFLRETLAWREAAAPALERMLPDGRWLLVSERPTPGGGHVGIRTDITQLRQAMEALSAASQRAEHATAEAELQGARLHAALENMSQGLCMVGADQRVIVCNRRFIEMFGLDPDMAAPGTPFDVLCGVMRARAAARRPLLGEVQERQLGLAQDGEGDDFLVEDAELALAISHRPMPGGGWVATYEDATKRRQAEAQVRFLAHHDPLTQLPNRRLFRERLTEAVRAGAGSETAGIAVLCLDLDRFKQVNDTLGHPVGDQLLVAVAKRLRNCVRECDLVARLGGDEFAIVHHSAQLPDTAEILARRVIETLSAPYELDGNRVVIGTSVGVALADGGEPNAEAAANALLKDADVALYQAKAQGRGTFCRYDSEMGSAALRRIELEADLREALEKEQFRLVYQPIRALGANRLCGFEALVRWSHPGRGQVSPAEFIPFAEETGLIQQLGAWILRTACAAARGWPSDVRLAVNLSPVQLRSAGLTEFVAETLRQSGLRPEQLELEITETALLKESDEALAVLQELRGLGIGISLDDFGTGYSSLRHLTSLPVDRIKIDRSFVSAMAERADCRAIVSSVASLARQLGVATTAEGVETAEQVRLVQAAGCTDAQGYFISKPLPLAEAAALLAARQPARATAA